METFFERDPYLELQTLIANDGILRTLNLEMSWEVESERKFDEIKNKMKARISEILENLKK